MIVSNWGNIYRADSDELLLSIVLILLQFSDKERA